MRVWLLQIWDRLRSSFWFVPLGMMLLAMLLALTITAVDNQVNLASDGPLRWLVVNPANARSTLSLLSGAMITLSGVVFSLTMVTLSLTSSQFGSRLLRTAMTDHTMQVALGAFLSTALYCLVVMRFISVRDNSQFVPHLAVSIGGLLAFASLVIMIVFVHNVGIAIQAQTVVAGVARDLDDAIKRLFPERMGEPQSTAEKSAEDDQPELGSREEQSASTLPAATEGYLQTFDVENLLAFARENDLVLELLYRPGDFVIQETPLVRLLNFPQDLDEEKKKRMTVSLNAAFITGRSRTPRQDVCCAVNDLVEVAVRALSPGINDPFTAITCIDRMTAAMTRLLNRQVPSPYRYDADQNLRVIAKPVPIPLVIESAFLQIGYYGANDWMVAVRMMEGLEQLIGAARRERDREAIREQARRLYHNAKQIRKEPPDKGRLKTLFDRICNPGEESGSQQGIRSSAESPKP